MVVPKPLLQATFDIAIGSANFGSGFLDDEEVVILREVAVLLGVDPMVATPDNFKCKYTGDHAWADLQPRYTEWAAKEFPNNRFCLRCNGQYSK